ncbi:MAG: hypothetical protein ABR985_12225 [Methanotrichaceae archaeon]|jgi:hypothetical protein
MDEAEAERIRQLLATSLDRITSQDRWPTRSDASAPRPGLMSRFIVAQDNVIRPYWSTSPNNFGGQYGASNNGDLSGDIYRLLGGVVLRLEGRPPEYAGTRPAHLFYLMGPITTGW